MSFNRNIEATELEPKTKIENATVHTSTVSQLKVKHKKVKIDRIYPPLRSKNLETLLTIVSAPASTLFWDPTKPNFFALIVSMDQLTAEQNSNESIYIKKKCIVRFSENAWGKRHHLRKTTFN